MTSFLLEHWTQVALLVFIVGAWWFALRVARRHLPYLFEPAAWGSMSVVVAGEGITLVEGRRRKTVPWREITAVRIRTTSGDPFAEDLFLEVDTNNGASELTIPSAAKGFDGLLQSVEGYLPGFDMERLVEATMSTEEREFLVWRVG